MLISEALEGKYIRSFRSFRYGTIQQAIKRENVWTHDGETAYACLVRPTYKGEGIFKPDFWTTIYVQEDN